MIRISHESPIALLEESRSYNDYDYALVHLFEEKPEYFEFFMESKRLGREIILDNSIFELGTAFDPERYFYWIEKLKPTWVILPDVLESQTSTLDKHFDFLDKYWRDLRKWEVKTIGVVQGPDEYSAEECFLKLTNSPFIDMVAIPFDFSWYNGLYNTLPKLLAQSIGRTHFLESLHRRCSYNQQLMPKIHLLGCSLVQEFHFYNSLFPSIYSVDTSNPIVKGIVGESYKPGGEITKPSKKLFELIDYVPDDDTRRRILENISVFRSVVNPEEVGGRQL